MKPSTTKLATPSERRKRLTFDIPASLHMKLKIASIKREETMADIICKLLEKELKGA